MISGYKRLDYIESSGTQYIDTLVQVSNTIKFVVNTSFTEYVDGSGHGAYGSSGDYRFHIGSGSATSLHYGISNSNGSTNVSSIETPTKITIDAINKNISINDTSVLTTSGSINFSNNIYLFKINSSSSTYYKAYAKSRVYDSQIYDNGTLVRDYLPCLRESDNEVGLYDEVNDVFYTNQGTGSFTYGHILENNITLTDNPLTLTLGDDLSLIGNFELLQWQVSTQVSPTGYGTTYGDGSYAENDEVTLIALPNANTEFVNWKLNGTIVSTNSTYSFTMGTTDLTYVATFVLKPYLTTIVEPSGYGTINGSGYYSQGTSVTLTATPSTHKDFVKWQINGQDVSTSNPYTYTMPSTDVTITGVFKISDKYTLTLNANPDIATLYQDKTQEFEGETIVIKARPLTNYTFVKWSDGNTNANRNYVMPSNNVNLTAYYRKNVESTDVYQYRVYVKDQLLLTQKPKAFMIATSFTIANDLLTTSNSKINVLEMASNINNGDILVLYNPKGKTLYCGVITKVEDLQIQCSQMQSFYKGNWVYNVSPQSYLETEIYTLLNAYASGTMLNSTYTDSLVAQRLGGITLSSVGSLTSSLPTKSSNSVMDMEEFIYDIYNDYGIIFDFTIGFSGSNTCVIKKPSYSSIKIGNNNYAISNLSPITQIEETNRLIVYGSDGTYKKTYVAKTDGTIVEEPSATTNRFNVTNTKIVFSDDTLSDLVASNLPTTMYNHKVTFTLRINNLLYDFDDFKLGMPLAIYIDGDYYNSVLTGWEITKSDDHDITEVKMICGKVRTSLTKMLSMKGGV